MTKIVSLIDTVRYRNWLRSWSLYIYALWADSLKSSRACNGHVNHCTRKASVHKSGQSPDELQRSLQPSRNDCSGLRNRGADDARTTSGNPDASNLEFQRVEICCSVEVIDIFDSFEPPGYPQCYRQ